jgi:hypothetical protein
MDQVPWMPEQRDEVTRARLPTRGPLAREM